MNRLFLTRLTLDLIAAGLLLFGLAYWWLGNVAHEIAGTVFFLLLIGHNVFNRRWYGVQVQARRKRRDWINIAATAALLVTMLVLLGTSILISNALSEIFSAWGGFTVRQIHTLAAYWALVIVSVHLGLRWPIVMAAGRSLAGIREPSAVRTALLRGFAFLIAAYGVWSSFKLAIGTKLRMEMTLDWWNFEASVAGFFIHALAVSGLYISLTYYATWWRRSRRSAAVA